MTVLATTLLALVPLIAVFATLLAGRYPGERLIEAARRPCRPRAASGAVPAAAGRTVWRPCAIGLLSCGLAGRAPPPLRVAP